MKAITVWERFYPDTNTWQFNHIADNHTELGAPIAISDLQKSAWKNATWRAHHAHLVGNVVKGYHT
jgi:hypothetical protein